MMVEAEIPATPSPAKKSDLGVRTLSAIFMLAVAGGAVWLGGRWLDAFVIAITLAVFGELLRLVLKADFSPPGKAVGLLAGAAYVGAAGWALVTMDAEVVVATVLLVAAIDIAAYFSGRTFGKRKIAPSISPSKTWAGLYGAMAVAGLIGFGESFVIASLGASMSGKPIDLDYGFIAIGTIAFAGLAVLAQAGDFLESWLKRRAGVKDSSNLLPGHGGFFDRVDGLIPVAIATAVALEFL